MEVSKWIYDLIYSKKDKEILDLNNTINLLNNNITELKKAQNLVEPKSYGTISITELRQLLTKAFPSAQIYLSDQVYGLTTKAESMKFSIETKVQYDTWISEQRDCDEFSFALMGYWNRGLEQFAFGICWSMTHAFNIFISKDKEIFVVEPQNNRYYTIDEIKDNPKYYNMRLIVI
jgi:hypothetical protein